MPRDLPIGNGSLLITFDDLYHVRDLYFPNVGRHNHTGGHIQHFGVWADGKFAWVDDDSWTRELRYLADTLVTEVRLVNENLGLEIYCNDAVDFHEPVYFRRCVVRDLLGKPRDVRLFYHIDLSIKGSVVGDTANYDPQTNSVVLYKEDAYFLVNACDQNKCGIDHWAIGSKRINDAEGTWRDAEDGQLGRNTISQGSVDATVGFNLQLQPNGEASVTSWIACGHSYEQVKKLNMRIREKTPERMLARTESYWRLWARKEPSDTSLLPEHIRDQFYRSMLIVRTQIDNGGAIIAANDSDITQFGGDNYSYCWMRDGALVAYALVLAGQSELSRSFFRFAAGCIEDEGYFLHKYNPLGQLGSSWHPWMLDGQRVLPIQQDETALVLWVLRKHFEKFRDFEFVKPLYSKLIAKPAEWMLAYRDHHGLPKQSWDLWEERRGVHTFTVASTIGALRAASLFARDFGEPDRETQFREAADRMLGALRRYLWHEDLQRFARMAIPLDDGTYRLDLTADSANYALFSIAGLDPRDSMVMAEMERIHERLWVQTDVGGYARYEHDYYHQIESNDIQRVPGNPWVICTLWQAQYLIARARTMPELRQALPLIEWAVERANISGVQAEQYHPHTGDPISVSPLTWSHSTYIIACIEYMERFNQIRDAQRAAAESDTGI